MSEIKKIGLFDFIKDISEGGQYIFDENNSSAYTTFMVNRGLGQHIDTVLLANETNKRPGLTKLMQFDFLFNYIEKKRRYGKWTKFDETDDDLIKFLQSKYGINRDVAIEYLKLYDREQLVDEKVKSENFGGKT